MDNYVFLGMREDSGAYSLTDERTGEVKSGDYHNFTVYYATDLMQTTKNTKTWCGYESCLAKIKKERAESVFGFPVSSSSKLNDMILKPCQIYYDRNGDIMKIDFPKESGK